jgi:uncharacterized protein RhaS with RHS repeats
MQVDPIGISGGYDTYGYVNQNPLNYNDPLGLEVIWDGQEILLCVLIMLIK